MSSRNHEQLKALDAAITNVEAEVLNTIVNDNFHVSDILYSSKLGLYIINKTATAVDVRIMGSPTLETPVWVEVIATQNIGASASKYIEITGVALAFQLLVKTAAGTSTIDAYVITRDSP